MVTSRDEDELKKELEKLELANREVSGDEDQSESETEEGEKEGAAEEEEGADAAADEGIDIPAHRTEDEKKLKNKKQSKAADRAGRLSWLILLIMFIYSYFRSSKFSDLKMLLFLESKK